MAVKKKAATFKILFFFKSFTALRFMKCCDDVTEIRAQVLRGVNRTPELKPSGAIKNMSYFLYRAVSSTSAGSERPGCRFIVEIITINKAEFYYF